MHTRSKSPAKTETKKVGDAPWGYGPHAWMHALLWLNHSTGPPTVSQGAPERWPYTFRFLVNQSERRKQSAPRVLGDCWKVFYLPINATSSRFLAVGLDLRRPIRRRRHDYRHIAVKHGGTGLRKLQFTGSTHNISVIPSGSLKDLPTNKPYPSWFLKCLNLHPVHLLIHHAASKRPYVPIISSFVRNYRPKGLIYSAVISISSCG